MNEKSNKTLTPYAQDLRREMTKEERHLWYDFLKKLPVTVNRQKVIGKYIADFYVSSANVVIELDGAQHYEPDAVLYDRARDDYMRSLGIKVLRYTDKDVNGNFSGVCSDIEKELGINVSNQNII